MRPRPGWNGYTGITRGAICPPSMVVQVQSSARRLALHSVPMKCTGMKRRCAGTGIGSRREAQLSEDTFSGKPRGEVQGCLPECETAAVRHERLCPETSGRSLQVGCCEVNI